MKTVTIERIITAARNSTTNREALSRIDNMQWAEGYCCCKQEYPHGVLISNWNDIDKYDRERGERVKIDDTMSRLERIFTKLGVECDWDDQTAICADCCKAIETEPTSFFWEPQYAIIQSDIVCHDCIRNSPSDYLTEISSGRNKPDSVKLVDGVDPAENGFILAAHNVPQAKIRELSAFQTVVNDDNRFDIWIDENDRRLQTFVEHYIIAMLWSSIVEPFGECTDCGEKRPLRFRDGTDSEYCAECCEGCERDENGIYILHDNDGPADQNYNPQDISEDALRTIIRDCAAFLVQNWKWISDDENCQTSYPIVEQAAHDFWLTRNHHGCGFWETTDWEESAGKFLTKSAHSFGEQYLCVNNDGELELSGGRVPTIDSTPSAQN